MLRVGELIARADLLSWKQNDQHVAQRPMFVPGMVIHSPSVGCDSVGISVLNQIRGQFDAQSGSSMDEAGGDFYALLGLTPFESNSTRISARARDLMRDARKYQVGPRAAEAQVKLERLAMASACLLDPSQKSAYDNALRDRFGLPPVSIRSDYVPVEIAVDERIEPGSKRRILSPRLALVLIIVLAIVAVIVSQKFQHSGSSTDSVPPVGRQNASPFQAQLAAPAAGATSLPSARPPAAGDPEDSARKVATASTSVDDRLPSGASSEASVASQAIRRVPKRAPEEDAQPATSVATSNVPNREELADQAIPRPPVPKQPAHPVQAPIANPNNPWPAGGQRQAAVPAIEMSSTELLRQLREFRLKRSPAMRMSFNPQMLGAQRVVELVQYGRTAFSDDRRFQRQLDQEVNALRRLYAPFRDVLPEPEH